MANMELITSVTVGSGGAASVTLPASGTIPQTYTDLKIVASARSDESGGTAQSTSFFMSINGVTTNRTFINLNAISGTTAESTSGSTGAIGTIPGDAVTSNTFNNVEIYIPNYTSTSINKSFTVDSVTENNSSTNNNLRLTAGLWSQTSEITTIGFSSGSGNLAEGSTFYLYGISSVPSSPKATGGIVSQDATYWYHMFPFSSTFTPTEALSADILCIAGGGGGGTYNYGGGGGAGGLRGFTAQSLTTTGYTITVGAGGAPGTGGGARGVNGGNSSIAGSGFTTITSSGGGGGGGDTSGSTGTAIGASGGSGGGNYNNATGAGGTGNAGSYSPSEGNNGGSGSGNAAGSYGAGGGGGAGGVANTTSGYGGVGSSTYSSWGLATFTGQIVGGTAYFAGGGGGGAGGGLGGGYLPNLGGNGGGGNSGVYNSTTPTAQAGLPNTGGGGGGGGAGASAAGGSGLVIVRYAK